MCSLACGLMSEEQLKAFLEKVKGDISLQEKLKAAVDLEAFLAIAKESGFSVSADDLKNTQPELSEKDLEGVTGAGQVSDNYLVVPWLKAQMCF